MSEKEGKVRGPGWRENDRRGLGKVNVAGEENREIDADKNVFFLADLEFSDTLLVCEAAVGLHIFILLYLFPSHQSCYKVMYFDCPDPDLYNLKWLCFR